MCSTFRYNIMSSQLTYSFNAEQSKNDIPLADRKILLGNVDIRRMQSDTHASSFSNIFRQFISRRNFVR